MPAITPAVSRDTAGPATAYSRWLAAQRVRLTAPASTDSAREADSSACKRSVADTAWAAAPMPRKVNEILTKAASSVAVPPKRAMMSRTVGLSPISSPTPCTMLPASRA